MLIHAGWSRILTGVGPWIVEQTAERIAASPAIYAWWGERILLHFPELFAYLASWGTFLVGAALAVGNAIGGYLGAHFTITRGERMIRLVLNLVLVAFIVKLLFDI